MAMIIKQNLFHLNFGARIDTYYSHLIRNLSIV